MSKDLSNLVALVTGGATGIGAACARLLAERGSKVLVADIDQDGAQRIATEIGDAARACLIDVRQPESVKAAVNLAVAAFGGLDVAVNNAGVGVPVKRDVDEMSTEDWHRVTSVNLDGVFYSMQAELVALLRRGGGSIVNMASLNAHVGIAGAAAYVAAKHGVLGLTKTAAIEYATRGIRVNSVCPGFIDTAISPRSPEEKQTLAARHPINRLGSSEEVAEVVAFLAGPGSSFVTGSSYDVDGGYVAL